MRARPVLNAALLFAAFAACAGGPDLGSREDPVTFVAEIDASSLGDPPPPESFSGMWELVLEGDRYRVSGAGFGGVTETIEVEEDRLFIVSVPAPEGAFNCYAPDGSRTLEPTRARYVIEVDGDALELDALHEPCPLRQEILSRTWRRAAPR